MITKNDQYKYIGTDVYSGGRFRPDIAGLHPGKFYKGLLKKALDAGVTVLNKTKVIGLEEEAKKFEARGEILNDWSVVDEPYKSIKKEDRRLRDIRREKRHAYVRTLVPLLKLAGYEKPEFYLWYYTSYHDEIRERHNIRNLGKIEEYNKAIDEN